jgi:hypothetical protein
MFKLCFLACLFVPVAATAQTAPKVVFVGEDFTTAWQSTPQFTANTNWIGAGVQNPGAFGGSDVVLENFQTDVINQHPAFVHIMTGFGDLTTIKDSTPLGFVAQNWESDIMAMVAMAQKANIKVILGNLPASLPPQTNPAGVQLFNAWLDQYGRANHIPVVNYHDALCQCVGSTMPYDTFAAGLGVPNAGESTPSAAGYSLITQMAQTAIATYGLTVQSGYLSNVLLPDYNLGREQNQPQVNAVLNGSKLIFTAQATWSDGVVRPLLNQNFDGMQGIWTSSNPAVMSINQQGQAVAYSPGTTTISFRSASGVPFSPWIMTVYFEDFQ